MEDSSSPPSMSSEMLQDNSEKLTDKSASSEANPSGVFLGQGSQWYGCKAAALVEQRRQDGTLHIQYGFAPGIGKIVVDTNFSHVSGEGIVQRSNGVGSSFTGNDDRLLQDKLNEKHYDDTQDILSEPVISIREHDAVCVHAGLSALHINVPNVNVHDFQSNVLDMTHRDVSLNIGDEGRNFISSDVLITNVTEAPLVCRVNNAASNISS
eukprot:CAMPEP_0184648938 /NCGR_PEP_ID=MMETSP0308-20130426/6189_1 /TAXON_ID=38269 /ORGANISM="Gloeochaete witrockiana, Strain SAG 46.84" /LENGTH=209 /DNA_ID=CAMNT_0027081249 /DNA_START=77 /DNA_END=702 /DNA_ORIENTATION=-